jgi:hypothetical protein
LNLSSYCAGEPVRIESITIAAIGAYNPWIHSHCIPEQAVQIDRRMDPGIIRYRS